ncbi:MAG: hypothetical protein KJ025_04800 [Burkholderiales bacterium]|nr:hypothetical protein [Burkholderiales bacterium]
MRRFVLLMLLAWLPIQAAAMPWLAFKCEQHEAVVHVHASAGGLGHHASGAGDTSQNGAEGGTISGVHTCCHHFPGAAAGLPQPAAAELAFGVEPRPLAHAFSFFPEPLKRPPLGALV